MNDFILSNELVNHVLEEKSIYWVDDLPFVATVIFGIKECSNIKLMDHSSIFQMKNLH